MMLEPGPEDLREQRSAGDRWSLAQSESGSATDEASRGPTTPWPTPLPRRQSEWDGGIADDRESCLPPWTTSSAARFAGARVFIGTTAPGGNAEPTNRTPAIASN